MPEPRLGRPIEVEDLLPADYACEAAPRRDAFDTIIRVGPPCQIHKPLIRQETRTEGPEHAPSPARGPSIVTR